MSRLYEREVKDFFEVAKIKMAGTSKEAKGKFGKRRRVWTLESERSVLQWMIHCSNAINLLPPASASSC